ncbi:MAG: membrane-bound lytic murein transglycosylase D [Bacteroidia bacterium]|jgi:membrane-bound lytic murein transglycosylase D
MNKSQKIWVATLSSFGILALAMVLQANSSKNEAADVTLANPTQFSDHYRITTPPIPTKVTFCDEVVPLSDFEVKERLEKEVLVNTYWQSSTMLMLKRTKRYFPMIDRVLLEEGVPSDFKYLAMAESGLADAVSSSGAEGIWQFMKSTALSYDLNVTTEIDERYHLEKATRAACKYLKHSKEQLGSWTLAAAAYNRGLAGVKRDLRNQSVESYFDLRMNSETSRYVFRIIALKLITEKSADYGFVLEKNDYYYPVPSYQLLVDSTIISLPEFAKAHGTTYKIIRILNPWLNDDHLTIGAGKSYLLTMPLLLAVKADE